MMLILHSLQGAPEGDEGLRIRPPSTGELLGHPGWSVRKGRRGERSTHRHRAVGICGDELRDIFPELSVRPKVSGRSPLKLLMGSGGCRRAKEGAASHLLPRGRRGPSCRLCDLHSALVSEKLCRQQAAPRDVLF